MNKYLNDYYYQLKNENIDEKERAIKKEIAYISYYKNQEFFNHLFDQDFNNIDISTNMYNMAIINEKNELINKNQIQQEIQRTLIMFLGDEIHNLKEEKNKIQDALIKNEAKFVEVVNELENLKEENNKFKQMQRITNNSPAFIKTLENLKNEIIEHRTPSPFFPSPFINNEISSQSLFAQEIENLKEENSKLKKENIYLKKQKFTKQKYHIEKLIKDKNKINLKLKQLQSKKVQIL
ncbi:hypothetical protein [Spiroplasma endosymbiont of Danaus chrysippus]|uniref:hypothetical protein n=1 Tax=Spiroplasma endosymbiont of Danaus chrysippus TaxID=2691041 RepID=UPI00157B0D65|nr:hypothetical protein [Spiroplasma endosymbiont of Danaus chrysippus]